MLERVLEPEVMDTAEEAQAYDAMGHTEGNAVFVERAIEVVGGSDFAGWVLDLGTGPGEIPIMLAQRMPGVHIAGVDLSWNMLRIAERRRLAAGRDRGVAHRLLVQHADVKALPFLDGSFDAVISNTILHHIPEPGRMLAEAARVLRPGGAVYIRDLFRPDSPQRLQELVQMHTGGCTPDQQQMFAASLHAALTPDELRSLADAAGLRDAEITVESDRHLALHRAQQ